VRCADLAAAVARGAPVEHCPTIGARQRTAAWTVLVSPLGVAEYLNKRISPVGAWRVCNDARQLGSHCRHASVVWWWDVLHLLTDHVRNSVPGIHLHPH